MNNWGHVVAAGKRSHQWCVSLTPPPPQSILKQWEEWHVIVSNDQLGETLRVAPAQLNKWVEGMAVRGGLSPLWRLICGIVNQLVREILHVSGKLQGNVREIQKPLAVVTMILKPPLPTVNIKSESPTSFYSLRRRPNVTPVSNVCEAATNPCVGFPTDSTNYRKCVSNSLNLIGKSAMGLLRTNHCA